MKELFCTCIIPTIGRDSLSRAVKSVLSQTIREAGFEIIVVNDSGTPLQGGLWQSSEKIRVIDTNRHERSVARNTGAAIARGQFLHFLDDDDWIAEGAYQQFFELSHRTDAAWLYGNTQLIDRHLDPTIVLQHSMNGDQFLAVMAGEWIPLQASLIRRDIFLQVGGFNPGLTGPEDMDLLRRILLKAELAETPNLIAYVIRGEEGSTTDYDLHSIYSRQARENLLEADGVFTRMCVTATDAFWQARLLRIYLTSTIWNLQHGRIFTALSRALYAIASMWVAGVNLFSRDFWSSVSSSYASPTFAQGIRLARKPGKT